MGEQEFVERTGEKCPVCGENIGKVGETEGQKSDVCSNCGVLTTLSVKVPTAFVDFLKSYFDFCGYEDDAEQYYADELAKEGVLIIRDLIDKNEEDRKAIVDRHGLRNIFEKADPNWLELIDKDC